MFALTQVLASEQFAAHLNEIFLRNLRLMACCSQCVSSLALSIDLSERPSSFRLGHRPALDGIRGLAIILVAIHHLCHIVPGLLIVISGGYLGVDLFFVLSGFLITSLLVEEHAATGGVSLSRFYIRRALRLLPAVAAALVFTVVVGLVLGFAAIGITPIRLVSVVGYFANWIRAYEPADVWFLSHFWSLAIEEQFYLIWPVLLIALFSIPRRAAILVVSFLAIGSAMLMAVLFLSGSTAQRIYTGSDTRAYQLLAGCLASMALHWGYLPASLNEKNRVALARASLLFLGLMFLRARDAFPSMYLGGNVIITAAAVMLILHVTVDRSRLTKAFEHPILVWFGKRSYGLYVWHLPIYLLIAQLGYPILTPFALVLAIAIAELSYRFIELPFLRLKSRYATGLAEVESRG